MKHATEGIYGLCVDRNGDTIASNKPLPWYQCRLQAIRGNAATKLVLNFQTD